MKVQIAEWWEVRWTKPGELVVTVDSGWPPHGVRPAGTFGSAEDARIFMRRFRNAHHRLIRVRRYAVGH